MTDNLPFESHDEEAISDFNKIMAELIAQGIDVNDVDALQAYTDMLKTMTLGEMFGQVPGLRLGAITDDVREQCRRAGLTEEEIDNCILYAMVRQNDPEQD